MMTEPTLHHVLCPAADAGHAGHRMAYWEWNATGNPAHPHVIVCVHGLTRQGRDFDVLARALCHRARVICPDVAGRGQSDWLADAMHYQIPLYAADMRVLLTHLQQHSPLRVLDWVGTSMGGLIGMWLCGQPELPLQLRRLVLNDVGPTLEWTGLARIRQYVGHTAYFATVEQAADALWAVSSSFGPHTREQWLMLSRPMLRALDSGGFTLHYDPAIAQAMQQMTAADLHSSNQALWQVYERITAQVLLLRGAQSDLLSSEVAQRMQHTGPRARRVDFAGVGHAPTLIAPDQVQTVVTFLQE